MLFKVATRDPQTPDELRAVPRPASEPDNTAHTGAITVQASALPTRDRSRTADAAHACGIMGQCVVH